MGFQNSPETPFLPDDMPPNLPEKPGHHLEFQEEFDAPTLNAQRWLPFYLPHWSGHKRAAARHTLPGKGLHLHIEHDQPAWLPDVFGGLRVSSVQTGGFSGPVGSRSGQHRNHPDLRVRESWPPTRLYTPRFGFIETRLRAVPIPGYMVALWMIGVEERPEESGEICVCEVFGQDVTPESAVVRCGVHPWGDPTLRDETHAVTLPLDASRYHVYAVDWRPDRLEFFVDNALVRTVHQSPQYEMQLMLGVYELPQQLTDDAKGAAWPRTAVVDYVRGYRQIDSSTPESS